MPRVTVEPTEFTYVKFDAYRIGEIASKLIDDVGLPSDTELHIRVDETTPLGRMRIESRDPLVVTAESGAFEDPKRRLQMSEGSIADSLGRLLIKEADRQHRGFGAPDPDESLDLAYSTAWEVYAVGRLARRGYRAQRQRRLYHFRNRCGFSDASDEAFEELWTADELSWGEIVGLVDGALAARDALAG